MRFFAFFLPSSSHSLPLSVKGDRALAVEVSSAPHACFVACERKHRQRHRDWQINSHLTCLDFVLELAGSVSILREDRTAIAPLVRVDKVNSLLQGVNSHNVHYWSKNFLLVANHTLIDVVDDSRTNPVAIRIPFNLHVATI